MHDNDKTCSMLRTACLCPNSCETNDDRQMRMTDKDTPQNSLLFRLSESNQPTLRRCSLAALLVLSADGMTISNVQSPARIDTPARVETQYASCFFFNERERNVCAESSQLKAELQVIKPHPLGPAQPPPHAPQEGCHQPQHRPTTRQDGPPP